MNLLSNIQNTVITIMLVFILVAGYSNESMAQKLQLVIGKYDCTKNEDCTSDQHCDIDTHRCINYADRANCPTCLEPECPEITCPMVPACPDLSEYIKLDECPTLPTCLDGEYNLNGTCVKCISNSDCSGDTPV